MAKEIKRATVTVVDNSDAGNVIVYGEFDGGDQFGLTTLTPICGLHEGETVNVVIDPNETLPIPGSSEVLENLPKGIWGNACNDCVHNPYVPRAPRQCEAAKKI